MTPKTFIEKAIAGGWDEETAERCYCEWDSEVIFQSIILDPLAWQAVGKAEFEKGNWLEAVDSNYGFMPQWRTEMHRMIDALIEGKTIEEFLETL